jgi:hypothetical protein
LDLLLADHTDGHAWRNRERCLGGWRRHIDGLLQACGNDDERDTFVLAVQLHTDWRTQGQQLAHNRELVFAGWKCGDAESACIIGDDLDAARGSRDGERQPRNGESVSRLDDPSQ